MPIEILKTIASYFVPIHQTESRASIDSMSHKFLVVSARQDELNAFLHLTSKLKRGSKKEFGVQEYVFIERKTKINILTYSPNKMGMAYNAASIMRIITSFQVKYTLFIGTCAGVLPDKNNIGDVLVPDFIYNYESGKHRENGDFESDHAGFQTSIEIRKSAETLKNRLSNKVKIITDDNFCSGSAVVDNTMKMDEIRKILPRKVSGLDMEAYSLACINDILRDEGKHITVVKSIMDFGTDKSNSEKKDNKNIAMKNSATVALEIIKEIHKP